MSIFCGFMHTLYNLSNDCSDSEEGTKLLWLYVRVSFSSNWELRISDQFFKNSLMRPGAVAQACNPSTLGGRDGWITRSTDRYHLGQHGETPSLLKLQKLSWARWCVPVIPAAREAEAGELPEPWSFKAAVSHDHATVLHPGWQSEILFKKKKIP